MQVVQSLRDQLPGADITWVAGDGFAPLVEACSTTDKTLIFRRKAGVSGFFKLVQEIRTERYDAIVDMQGLARSALMTFFGRAARKLGRRDAREGAFFFYDGQPSLPPGGRGSHAVEILLEFLPMLNLEAQLGSTLRFQDDPQWECPWGDARPLLLFPNSRRKEKEWPYFTELVRLLFECGWEGPIAWVGQEALPVSGDWPEDRFYNLIGKTGLVELPRLIRAAKKVVSNDSGPMHLAAAMGVPLLALFGPTEPERFGPYPLDDPKHTVLKAPGGDLSQLSARAVCDVLLST
ncbi:MAG: lipopolysaccharide heptosyltransferase I [Opitutales bacterium]